MLYSQRYEKAREVLRQTRLESGLTQAGLAEKLACGQSHVSKLERGERYIDVLEFILWCEACGVAPDKVIGEI
ncbi:MAG: helix-turn-helix domain-containing protein [Candidatus Accumulibacter sp.]|jgi:transcriptional regulator with XRE-family HTH domain|nr:helix-turn-helix domain-containing protein [Accumulibacter sp.]